MTVLADLAVLARTTELLLVRVVAVHGADRRNLGTVRAYRGPRSPAGELWDPGLHAAADRIAAQGLPGRDRARLVAVQAPAGGTATLLVQSSDDVPEVAWDLMSARCSVALLTRFASHGSAGTTAVVRAPGLADPPQWSPGNHSALACAVRRLSQGTSEVALHRHPAGQLTAVETACPPYRLVVAAPGGGAMAGALVDAARLLHWTAQACDRLGDRDLQYLTAADAVIVIPGDAEPSTAGIAAALTARAGYVGFLPPAGWSPAPEEGATLVGSRLHIIDVDDRHGWSAGEHAMRVLAQIMTYRARTWCQPGVLSFSSTARLPT